MENEYMPKVQEENKKETQESEEEWDMDALPPTRLEGEVKKHGWSIQFLKQDEENVWFKVYCRDARTYTWYGIKAKCPKKKFLIVGG